MSELNETVLLGLGAQRLEGTPYLELRGWRFGTEPRTHPRRQQWVMWRTKGGGRADVMEMAYWVGSVKGKEERASEVRMAFAKALEMVGLGGIS